MMKALIKKQIGISLIELVIFIVILGIIATGSMIAIQNVLRFSSLPNKQLQAASLARSRMAIILQQRKQVGFNGFIDLCSSSSPPNVCTKLSQFATQQGLAVTTNIQTQSQHKLITVSVSGLAQTLLITRVADHESF